MALPPSNLFPSVAMGTWPAGAGLCRVIGAAGCESGKRAGLEVGPMFRCCLYVLSKCEGWEGVCHRDGPSNVGSVRAAWLAVGALWGSGLCSATASVKCWSQMLQVIIADWV